MQLYFIRHGQSANNLLWDQTGDEVGRSDDPELTEAGQKQAQLVAQFLGKQQRATPPTGPALGFNDFRITHLYASPMVRAMDTAEAISAAIDLQPVVWEEIHESGGIWLRDETSGQPAGRPGRNRADLAGRYPKFILPDYFNDQGWWNRPFETDEGCQDRARRFAEQLRERHGHTEDGVAIVSHGAFYNYLLGALLNIPVGHSLWFVMNNTALTRIDFIETGLRIAYSNRTDFLPPELVT